MVSAGMISGTVIRTLTARSTNRRWSHTTTALVIALLALGSGPALGSAADVGRQMPDEGAGHVPSLVQQLRDVFATFPRSKWGHVKLVVAPDRRLRTRLAILAWRRIDELDEFDRERLLRFYRTHVDRGPEDVP